MISRTKSFCLLIAICLTATASLALADEPIEPDRVSIVTANTDIKWTAIATAIATQDSALLVSIFSEDIHIAMPGGNNVVGRPMLAKYSKTLFKAFGGCELTYDRQMIDMAATDDNIAFDRGTFALARHTNDQVDTVWNASYTIYWQLADSTWTMGPILLGRGR